MRILGERMRRDVAYYQICMDDSGPYMIAHSYNPDFDLVQYDNPPDQELMRKVYIDMFGGAPSDWPQHLSVMSHFERKRWAKIKTDVDKWR